MVCFYCLKGQIHNDNYKHEKSVQTKVKTMKTCVAIRHIHFEDLGVFAYPIEEAGYKIVYLEAGQDELVSAKHADLVVFLGGPLSVNDRKDYPYLDDELHIAESRLNERKPVLGICLGAQIIAHAAGSRVYAGDNGKEIGWSPIKLTQAGQRSVIEPLGSDGAQMFHWHGDTFDLPGDCQLLASTDSYENQIYKIDDFGLAFQCHPELDAAAIERWLVGHAFEIAKTPGIDPASIRQDTMSYGESLAKRGRQTVENWLAGLKN